MDPKEAADVQKICSEASDRLKKLEILRRDKKGESPEAQKISLQLKDDLDGISNRVNQCAAKPTGDMPTSAVFDKLNMLLRDPLKDDGSGMRACRKIISDARQLARFTTGANREALLLDASNAENVADVLEGTDKINK